MTYNIGSPGDVEALGRGSVISQLKRLRQKRHVKYNLPPMWGASRLRSEQTITNDSGSAEIVEDGGEIRLTTGATGTDRVEDRTARFAQYRSGVVGDASFGIRIPSSPTGSQVVRWGYFNDDSGFGWGVDADSLFTFFREGGTDTIYRPEGASGSNKARWRGDSLDGDGESGVHFDIADGAVFHVAHELYGHGPVVWYVAPKQEAPKAASTQEVTVDSRVYGGRINLKDFNRQLRIEVDNGGTASGLNAYVGGRQYTVWGDAEDVDTRGVPELERNYSVSTINTWEPLIAVRKKNNFPPGSGRDNTVPVEISGVEATADGASEIRLTLDATVDNADADWTLPTGWTDGETAIETIRASDSTITVSADGLPLEHAFLGTNKNAGGALNESVQRTLGADIVAVLWGRAEATATSINASITAEEYW